MPKETKVYVWQVAHAVALDLYPYNSTNAEIIDHCEKYGSIYTLAELAAKVNADEANLSGCFIRFIET